ncbi:hypothetical protein [Streptosporangium vulgare]|uniref:hypothetical protein n=1 Tax=Streptosporangium vulgare TaxID=46190 RepID=UPI0031D60037
MAEHSGGTRFYGQDGAIRRTLVKTGRPAGGEDAFTPSGRGLMTWCPSSYTEHVCVWDRTSGKLAAKVPGIKPKALWGWWDEKHFIAVIPASGHYQVVLSTLKGKTTRVLAAFSADDWSNKLSSRLHPEVTRAFHGPHREPRGSHRYRPVPLSVCGVAMACRSRSRMTR